MKSLILVLVALLMAAGVALSAAGSHMVSDPQLKDWISKAFVYQAVHSIALIWALSSRAARWAPPLFFAGIVLFSGSLYSAAFLSTSTRLAPVGGLLLILGWIVLSLELARGSMKRP